MSLPPALYPASGIARAAGANESLVRFLTREGKLHPIRVVGGRYLYTDTDIAIVRAHVARRTAERSAA